MYIRKPNFNEDLQKAKDSSSTEDELESILRYHHGEKEIAEAVAANPSCPAVLFAMLWICLRDSAESNPMVAKYKAGPNWHSRIKHSIPTRMYRWSNYISRTKTEYYKVAYLMENAEPDYQRFIMSLEPISKDIIKKYLYSKSAPLRKVIAARKDLPEEFYNRLSNDTAKTVRQVLASNPSVPSNVIGNLTKDKEFLVTKVALDNPNCPDEAVIAYQMRDKQENIKSPKISELEFNDAVKIAIDPASAPESLVQLASSEDPCIRFLIGFNYNTPSKALEQVAVDELVWVRSSVAFNKNTPLSSLDKLLKIDNEDVQIGLASNPSLPENRQLDLASKAGANAAYELANLTSYDSVHYALIKDLKPAKKANEKTWKHHLKEVLVANEKNKSQSFGRLQRGQTSRHCFISRIASKSDSCPTDLMSAYAYYSPNDLNRNPKVALALLEGRTIKPEPYKEWKIDKWLGEGAAPGFIARYYINSKDKKRQAQALSSWTTPIVDIIPFIRDPDTNSRKRIPERSTLIHFMFEMLARDEKPGVREKVAKHKNCPKTILESLACDKVTTVKVAASENMSSSSTLVKSTSSSISNEGPATERARLAKKTNDTSFLSELVTDRSMSVRLAVAGNMKTPLEVLEELSKDSKSKVRKIIASRLKDQAVIGRLLNDDEKEVRIAAANNQCWYSYKDGKYDYKKEFLELASKARDKEVRIIAAKYSADEKILKVLMEDSDDVLLKLAANLSFTDEDRVKIAEKTNNQDILAELITKTRSPELFILVLSKITSNHVSNKILSNLNMLSKPNVQEILEYHPLKAMREGLKRFKSFYQVG
ncbi:HEAT repeat domain-containing protein [Pleionea mediterranea]|uniref:Leucine rich repeat (LRR) protein n=1 Tax=Pleionea mediterranea TaxID=523701 RepID=A0A316F924_9GAMM|nr:HEAT repeat domain-containing protein [Pleionea mediterranea]PWK42191.1 hypothetical protein C8D97_11925 [Pleionea mediterranea]